LNLIHVRQAVDRILSRRRADVLSEPVLPAARPVVMASLAHLHSDPVLILTGRVDQAELLAARIGAYLPAERRPQLWDTPQSTPFEQLPFEHAAPRMTSARCIDASGLANASTRTR
jgi:hypothetical protein